MSASGREAFPDVREWSGGPPGCPGIVLIPYRMFGRTSWMYKRTARLSGSGREALPKVWEWSGGPPGCPRVVGRPHRIFGSGPDTLPDVRELH